MQADILRDKFLEFFKARKHKLVESDSLVPRDDPTVLFTPAGMNQFKKEFLGFDSGFKRAATSQRCLRTDDLDKVGKTSSHHTFFEMLGNFSFGDYFKKEAILWAWEFLTKELKIPIDKLWVSVYTDDNEAYDVWLKDVGISESKIIKLGDKDNFWPAEAKIKGPNGPCGPCSEIFYDFGPNVGCMEAACNPSCSCGRFVEIWNLVFTQFNRKEDGSLEPLPNKNIDTGMGLERLVSVMEGKQNNFETDLFQPIIKEIRREVTSSESVSQKRDLYAVADHARAVTFSIYDGIFPSNEGRGYVVRKIIRKSIMHLRSLKISGPLINRLVPVVAEIMHKPYPDLKDKQEDISRVILEEENAFIAILSNKHLVDEGINKIICESGEKPGEDGYNNLSSKTSSALGAYAFELGDTHGIPVEIVKEILDERRIRVDKAFEDTRLLNINEQKNRSKSQSKMKGDVFSVKELNLPVKETEFLGYKSIECQAKILAIIKGNKILNEAAAGESVDLILDKSVFYAEAGGQIGDSGEITKESSLFKVLDTDKFEKVYFHRGKIEKGSLKVGDKVKAKVDYERRLDIARNHTATHILQAALRKVLGSHVQQQGSLVSDDKFRFDFTHFKGLSKDELKQVEDLANSFISEGHDVLVDEMGLKEARETKALAFFGEKYENIVRVVSVSGVSKEFCGGTHVNNTSDIGLIKIIQESSVASGIRRIEAVTHDRAKVFMKESEERVIIENRKRDEKEKLRNLEKRETARKIKYIESLIPDVIDKSIKINELSLVCFSEDNLDLVVLRQMVDLVKEKVGRSVIALGSTNRDAGKAFLVIGLTTDLISLGFDAGMLIREVAPIIGGSGGGRKDFAQAGGDKLDNFKLAFDKLKDIIESRKAERER